MILLVVMQKSLSGLAALHVPALTQQAAVVLQCAVISVVLYFFYLPFVAESCGV